MKEDNTLYFDPADTPSGNRVANPLGLRRELNRHALTRNLVLFDEFSQRIVLNRPVPRPGLQMPKKFEPRPWEDTDAIALIEHLNHRGFKKVGRDVLHDVILLEARSHGFHPVRDYLDGLQWDKENRLSSFLINICGGAVLDGKSEEEKEQHRRYVEAVTRAFFISAVARIYQPGCKVDSTPILEGVQGTLKSSLLRTIAVRDEWFSDSLPHDLASKDARQHLNGVWIVELSEVAQFKRSEIESVKYFLSCQIDRYRPPYARSDVSMPRQNVFVGTTNSDVYLQDMTGNRRFWPVRITRIKLSEAREVIDQLWAEAVDAWRCKEKWWLPSGIEKLAVEHQNGRLAHDPWHDRVAVYVESRVGGQWITTTEVLDHIDVKFEHRDRSHEMRVGAMLRQFGCERRKRKIGDKLRWAYQTPKPSSEDQNEGDSDDQSL